MALSPAEQAELNSLQHEDAVAQGLTPEEEAELKALQADEARMRQIDPPGETLGSLISRNLNRIGGTTRLLVKTATDHGVRAGEPYDFGTSNLDPTVDSPQERAAKGKAGPGPELPAGALKAALEGRGKPSSELYPGIGPVAGFGADMFMDPTFPMVGAVMRHGALPAARGTMSFLSRLLQPEAETSATTLMTRPSTARDAVVAAHRVLGTTEESAARPLRALLQAAGRKVYKRSLEPLEKAQPGITDELFNEGFKTTARGAEDNITKLIDQADDTATEIARSASHQGGRVNLNTAMGRIREKIASLKGSHVDDALVDRWNQLASRYEQHGGDIVQEALAKKADAEARMLRAYDETSQAAAQADADFWGSVAAEGQGSVGNVGISKALDQQARFRANAKAAEKAGDLTNAEMLTLGRQGYADAIGDSIAALPGEGGQASQLYRASNDRMGRLINARKGARTMGQVGPLITPTEALGTGVGLMTGMPVKTIAKMGAIKRALQAVGGPMLGTYGGRALYRLGEIPLTEPALLQGAIHAGSPWDLLPEEENK
jgi:hypothetical protein